MAKGARELMKRKVEQGVGHVEKTQQVIMELGEFYADDHAEIVDQLKTIYAFFEQGKALLQSFRQTY